MIIGWGIGVIDTNLVHRVPSNTVCIGLLVKKRLGAHVVDIARVVFVDNGHFLAPECDSVIRRFK